MERLAGLEVTTKSVERVSESIGADFARREQEEIDRAVQLDLPIIPGEPGMHAVQKETAGRKASSTACPPIARTQTRLHVHGNKWDEEGFAIRDPDCTSDTDAIKRLYVDAWKRGPKRRLSSAMAQNGSGTSPKTIFLKPLKWPSIPRVPALVGLGTNALRQRHQTP